MSPSLHRGVFHLLMTVLLCAPIACKKKETQPQAEATAAASAPKRSASAEGASATPPDASPDGTPRFPAVPEFRTQMGALYEKVFACVKATRVPRGKELTTVLRFTVMPTGEVSSAEFSGLDAAATCVKEVALKQTFPSWQGTQLDLSVPFRFTGDADLPDGAVLDASRG